MQSKGHVVQHGYNSVTIHEIEEGGRGHLQKQDNEFRSKTRRWTTKKKNETTLKER
jgi:hypothetical protein